MAFFTGITTSYLLNTPNVASAVQKYVLWAKARSAGNLGLKPSLDLDFAGNKSLVDNVTGASLVTFTRASSGTFVGSDGVLQTAATDAPRFDHNPTTGESLGLLVEEQRTNSITNNTMVGAVAGTPGTRPTGWPFISATNGLVSSIVGTGTESGIAYIDLRISGTATAAAAESVAFGRGSALTGQTWTVSSYFKLSAGSLSGVTSSTFDIIEETSANAFITGEFISISLPTTASLITQRPTASRTLTGGVTVGSVRTGLTFNVSSGSTVDFTLRIGLPQLEQGAFATSPILTTTTAATRSADVASITGSAFSGWYNASQGALHAEYSISFDSSVSVFPILAGFSDNTLGNASIHYNRTVDDGRRVLVRSGGTSSFDQSNAGAYVYGQIGRQAFAYTSSEFAFSAAGVAPTVSSSITWPTVDRFGIGNNAFVGGSLSPLNGHIRRLTYWPTRLANSTLQTLTQ